MDWPISFLIFAYDRGCDKDVICEKKKILGQSWVAEKIFQIFKILVNIWSDSSPRKFFFSKVRSYSWSTHRGDSEYIVFCEKKLKSAKSVIKSTLKKFQILALKCKKWLPCLHPSKVYM